jgi:hypothetical protein
VALSVLLLGACSDDDDDGDATDAAGDIADIEEWCEVVQEVDDRFLEADTSEEAFAVRQAQYAEIRARVQRLIDGLDVVDEEARDDVAEGLDFAHTVAAAFADAENDQEVEDVLAPLFTSGEDPTEGAEPYIRETCGVDIDD